MENENTNEKKKQIILILVGVVTLLVAILGATYAYFQINTDTDSSNTTITGKTPSKSLVTLIPGTDNLHLNISASDMSYENRTNEYYGTDGKESYVGTEELGTKTIAEVELTGGEATTKYSCTAKLTVSKVTESAEDKDTMIEVLKPGDMFLQFKGNIISNILDLSMLKETGSKEYDLNFKITGNTTKNIQAYIKLVNKDEPQNYLAGKKLNIDISTSDLQCNVYIEHPTIAQLRTKDTQGYLSEDLQGGMYRYQASFEDSDSSEMTNWICFGTTDNCGTNEGNIDKYMYRIIGITEEGQMYLIKETFLKEGESTGFVWHNQYETSTWEQDCRCDNGICPEWPDSLLFKRINGTSNGKIQGTGLGDMAGTDIFVDSEYYDYLKSGDNDGVNGTSSPSKWYNLIVDHNWMYGDTREGFYDDNASYLANDYYSIETGEKDATHYVGTDGHNILETYNWKNNPTLTAKISLMYIHDYLYAYPGGNPENVSNAKNSWIHSSKDGYNSYSEWLSTRLGFPGSNNTNVIAWEISTTGDIFKNIGNLFSQLGVRPVFYLSQNAKIKSGNGTKTDPYILDVNIET